MKACSMLQQPFCTLSIACFASPCLFVKPRRQTVVWTAHIVALKILGVFACSRALWHFKIPLSLDEAETYLPPSFRVSLNQLDLELS